MKSDILFELVDSMLKLSWGYVCWIHDLMLRPIIFMFPGDGDTLRIDYGRFYSKGG